MLTLNIVENSDHKILYGILTVNCDSQAEVQNMIYAIKNGTEDIFTNGSYTLDDIIERFPAEWNADVIANNSDLIVEI